MLEEAAFRGQSFEGLGCDEVVMNPWYLAWSRGARRVAYREDKSVWMTGEEEIVEGALANAGRARNNEGPPIGGRRGGCLTGQLGDQLAKGLCWELTRGH